MRNSPLNNTKHEQIEYEFYRVLHRWYEEQLDCKLGDNIWIQLPNKLWYQLQGQLYSQLRDCIQKGWY